MIKIATHIAYKYGMRSLGLMIPTVYTKDNKLIAKRELDIYRTIIDGKDALVIIPVKVNGDGNKDNQSENSIVTEL